MMDIQSRKHLEEAYNKGYRIRRDGKALSPRGRVLAERKAGHGYYAIGLRVNDKVCNIPYHQLMAYQKFGELLFDVDCVRHLNGNCLDNSYENIEIGTLSDNMMDIPKEVRISRARKASPVKYNNVQEIKDYYKECHSLNKTMKRFGMSSKSTVHFIVHHRVA